MEKHIKECANRIIDLYRKSKGSVRAFHQRLYVQGYYKLIGTEVLSVLFLGFLISIALVAFQHSWKPWLSLSYGLVPWIMVQLMVYAKKEWFK